MLQKQILGSTNRFQRELKLTKKQVTESKKKFESHRNTLNSKNAELKAMHENQQMIIDQNETFREQIEDLVKNQDRVLKEKENALLSRDEAIELIDWNDQFLDETIAHIHNLSEINDTLLCDHTNHCSALLSRDVEIEDLNILLLELREQMQDMSIQHMLQRHEMFQEQLGHEHISVDSISNQWRKVMSDAVELHEMKICEIENAYKEEVEQL
eukprot:UN26531